MYIRTCASCLLWNVQFHYLALISLYPLPMLLPTSLFCYLLEQGSKYRPWPVVTVNILPSTADVRKAEKFPASFFAIGRVIPPSPFQMQKLQVQRVQLLLTGFQVFCFKHVKTGMWEHSRVHSQICHVHHRWISLHKEVEAVKTSICFWQTKSM